MNIANLCSWKEKKYTFSVRIRRTNISYEDIWVRLWLVSQYPQRQRVTIVVFGM